MFSGIVETTGIINSIEHKHNCIYFTIKQDLFDDLSVGDSVSVNGVCLTITKLFNNNTFDVTAVPETLRVTNLGQLAIGSIVNLERSLKFNGRIGGHMVQGHVDHIGEIIEVMGNKDEAVIAKISLPSSLSKYIVNKGYIALDGMSITVIEAHAQWFTVTFIPHTQAVTVVNDYTVGSKINIEVDILGKYVEKLLGVYPS